MTGQYITGLQQFSQDMIEVVARCRPAVATIHHHPAEGESSGSGFLLDGAGHVVTNYHVVEESGPDLRLQFATGLAAQAEVVGADPLTDLAVVQAHGPLPEPLGVRAQPAVLGEICLAMGSPFGDYTESVSLGIVSGLTRTIPTSRGRPLERAIQTDAAISPGNSGGPLVDVAGMVLGVSTCVDVRGVGIGFAVPGETIDWVVRQILRHGDVQRGALGVAVATRVENVEGQFRHAPVITRVTADLACDLRPGDVILAVAGRPVTDRADIYYLLTRDIIGTLVAVEVLRDGQRVIHDVPVRKYLPPAAVNSR